MAKSFIDANVSTEKDAMVKQNGAALALTGSVRVLYDDSLQKRQLVTLIGRIADKAQETYNQSASSIVAQQLLLNGNSLLLNGNSLLLEV